jgi:adenylate cyclase
MTRAVHTTGGIIDKYTGDGLMALWNVPRRCDDHAVAACEAALGCTEAIDRLFSTIAWRGMAPWRTRFGLHRAEVIVGHFGAPDRMSYTAMGDGVNVAARLESLNKQYGTRILVSATIEADARERFLFRRLDRVALKGKRRDMEVFELLGRQGGEKPSFVERYERALEVYRRRGFGEALELLREQLDDPPSCVLAARCRRFLTEAPGDDWDGVNVTSEK